MTIDTPRRRGRPPLNATIDDGPQSADIAPKSADEAPRRRKRASTGGFNLKLEVPERPGYHRRWFNDEPGRLAFAHDMAYDFVTDGTIKSDSPDKRVRRFVGSVDGHPLYAYLMECPLEEYEAGKLEKREATLTVDKAIAAGRDMDGRLENQYGQGSIRQG